MCIIKIYLCLIAVNDDWKMKNRRLIAIIFINVCDNLHKSEEFNIPFLGP